MLNGIEKTAKTVDEAIDLALLDLNVDREMVHVEVIDEGNRGIFGFIGNKLAKVRVKLLEVCNSDKASLFISDVLEKMGVEAVLDVSEEDGSLVIRISGENVGLLIGRRGETLDALQYLTGLVVNKEAENHQKVIIDIESYRSRREETLINLAERLARKVMKTAKSVTLEPMTPYERRIIHSALQGNSSVDTYSIGDEPYRKIVIKPK